MGGSRGRRRGIRSVGTRHPLTPSTNRTWRDLGEWGGEGRGGEGRGGEGRGGEGREEEGGGEGRGGEGRGGEGRGGEGRGGEGREGEDQVSGTFDRQLRDATINKIKHNSKKTTWTK